MTDNTKTLYNALDKIKELEKENEQLKIQIEKMKCCGNCKHSGLDVAEEPCCSCNSKTNKWELAE